MLTEKPAGRIIALFTGVPRRLRTVSPDDGRAPEWESSIFRDRVPGPLRVLRDGPAGALQADTLHHGGPDMALLAYCAEHYEAWRHELGREDIVPGGFGENLTIEGLSERTVCEDDVFAAGDVVVQVSKLRYPCWKLARRLAQPDMVERVLAAGRPGWYCRVLVEGDLNEGEEFHLVERKPGASPLISAP